MNVWLHEIEQNIYHFPLVHTLRVFQSIKCIYNYHKTRNCPRRNILHSFLMTKENVTIHISVYCKLHIKIKQIFTHK